MAITSKTDLLRIQKSARDILKQIHAFCEEHHIHYTVWGGTLIGTIRHQGIIPWDDDIDIAMERNEYDRFLALFQEHKDEYPDLFLQTSQTDPYYFFGFAKVRNLKTKGREALHVNMPYQEGVFLDIFPLDYLPGTSQKTDMAFCRKVQLWELLLTLKVAIKFPPKAWQKWAARSIHVASVLPLLLFILSPSWWLAILQIPFTLLFLFLSYVLLTPYHFLVKKRDSIIRTFQNQPSSFMGMFLIQKKEYYRMPSEWFHADTPLMPFDDIVVRASSAYDAILRYQYGNYLQFPPENKSYGKHAYVGLITPYDKELQNK